jgi:hypothetical protein
MSSTKTTKKGTKRACPTNEVPPSSKKQITSKSCAEDMRAILRVHGESFEREVSRLGPNELELLGVADVMSAGSGRILCDEYEPSFAPRKVASPEEQIELDAMRLRRNTLIKTVLKMVDGRFARGFKCTRPEWITMVKNLAMVAAVGAENMHGPFDFCEWILKFAREHKMIDPKAFPHLGVTQTDVQLMFAISIYTFVQACWCVHLSVRDSHAIPAIRRGDLLYALRVTFGTFSVPGKRRDTTVLTLAAMMLASTLSYEAIHYVPSCLAEIRIPADEWPVLTGIPIELFLRSVVVPDASSASATTISSDAS